MRLKSIELTNFRCFESLTIEIEPKLTVLVGQNASGKTAILDAIAVGLGPFLTRLPQISGMNFKESDFRINSDGTKPPYMRVVLKTTNNIEWDRTEKRDKTKETQEKIPKGLGLLKIYAYADMFVRAMHQHPHSHEDGMGPAFDSLELPMIAYYGTGRAVIDVPQRRRNFRKEFKRFQAYESALDAKTNFKRFFEWFYYIEDVERREKEKHRNWDYKQPELSAIRLALERFLPGFSNPRTELSPLRFLLDWQRAGQTQPFRIEQLSDGFRTILAMVMDIAARMAEANPQEKNILSTPGIVLIDEVDLHLHPDWQQRIISELLHTFPRVQFVMTTHSPQVISTVPAECIRVLSDGQVYSAPAGTQGAESSRILKRVFGVDPRPKNDEKAILLKKYLDLVYDDQWTTDEAIELRHKLDMIYYSEEPALADADIFIQNRIWELEDDGR